MYILYINSLQTLEMQFVTIVLSLFMTVALGYDEKFDKIDVDKILSDDVLLTSYLNCFLDKGPCTEEYASEYKGTTVAFFFC